MLDKSSGPVALAAAAAAAAAAAELVEVGVGWISREEPEIWMISIACALRARVYAVRAIGAMLGVGDQFEKTEEAIPQFS